jgi:hypothetical protein
MRKEYTMRSLNNNEISSTAGGYFLTEAAEGARDAALLGSAGWLLFEVIGKSTDLPLTDVIKHSAVIGAAFGAAEGIAWEIDHVAWNRAPLP